MKNKELFLNIFTCLLFVLVSINIKAQINPGVDFDLNGFINDKLDSGETTIIIPPGRYRVDPITNYHMLFENRNNVTIIADGVEMICTETVQGIRIQNCSNFKIQGLTIDYDPLPFTQGEIVEISPDKTMITVDIIDGYSSNALGNKVEIYDASTGELAMSTYYGATVELDDQNRKLFITKPTRNFDNLLKLGDIVVLNSSGNRLIPHSIIPQNCTNLTLENVTVYASTSFSFLEVNCTGSKYINCSVDRRPLETEVRTRGLKRMRSGNADAFHSKYSEIGPSYVGCIARYNGDDSFAINGDFHFISETNGNILTVIAKGGGNNVPNLLVGETAEMISYTGERKPDAIITKIEKGRALNQSEIDFFTNRTSFRGAAARSYTANNVYYITIDQPVDLPMGSLINSASRVGNGFEVRNCISGPNRSRGILVKASNGIITGNTCVGNWFEAIKCSPEYNWFEAGSSNNIQISNNEFIGCRYYAINVDAPAGDGSIPQAGAHKNFQIFNNVITDHLGDNSRVFRVTSTNDLCFSGNTHNVGDPQVNFINVEMVACSDVMSTSDIDVNNAIVLTTDADGSTNATPGDTVTFTVTVNNSGPNNTTGVQVTYQIPSGYTIVGTPTTSQGTYTIASGLWNIGTINNAANATLDVVATINATGNYINIAELTASDNFDPDSTPNNNEITEDDQDTADPGVSSLSDIEISKSVVLTNDIDGNSIISVGDTITWLSSKLHML